MMSLVNDIVKKLIIKYGLYSYANMFAEKMWVNFAFAKATHIYFSTNHYELDTVLTRAVNIWPLTSSLS